MNTQGSPMTGISSTALPAGRHSPASRQRSARGISPYWLIPLFVLYGMTFNLMGQWRYIEVVLIVMLLFNFRQAMRHVGQLERRFIKLFVLAAVAHLIADIVNDVLLPETAKRVGTYLFLALLIIPVQWLSRNDPRRIAFILAGYCASFVLMLFIGMSTNSAYSYVPWRLGLGHAATIALCLAIAVFPRARRFAGLALMALAVFHIAMDARTMAAVTFVSGVLAQLAFSFNNRFPSEFRLDYVAIVAVLAIVGGIVGMAAIRYAVDNRMFHEELQAKMELQMSNPYGLLAAGRPQTVTALYAISKKPFFGYGTTANDPDVQGFLIELSALTYLTSDRYDQMLKLGYESKRHFATPSHSHLFSAWADAGILAALCWFAFLGLTIYILFRAMFWSHPWAPLFTYIALSEVWSILFSPGPIRMEIALILMIFSFATVQFRAYDEMWQARTESARG